MTPFSVLLVGSETLTLRCGQMLLDRGHRIAAVLTESADLRGWAARHDIRCDLPAAELGRLRVDWLLSVAHLRMVPPGLLALAERGGVNFHDGPLPGYAGLNTPVWALLNGEGRHGIRWHRMTEKADDGAILVARDFDLMPDDTALSLNTRCMEAGIDSFPELLTLLQSGPAQGSPQPPGPRRLYRRADRPAAAARLDLTRPAAELARLVRALDHGHARNPLSCPKIEAGGRVLLVLAATADSAPPGGTPGQVLSADPSGAVVACGAGALRITRLATPKASPSALPRWRA
jgi:methionyl-tRNA formyltransferase